MQSSPPRTNRTTRTLACTVATDIGITLSGLPLIGLGQFPSDEVANSVRTLVSIFVYQHTAQSVTSDLKMKMDTRLSGIGKYLVVVIRWRQAFGNENWASREARVDSLEFLGMRPM